MKPDEIVVLAGRPNHSIGAHSVRHLMLPRQTPSVQGEEIAASRRTLETLLGHPIREFAYPYGAYDEHVVGEVRAAGFDVAVTCDEDAVRGNSDCLRLPRREITPGGSANFATWLRQAPTI
jgi:peptidoglycan/xylan/chitin deacetylase (PgdA/CDA1 family)